jgi:hypothetical protein
MAILYCGGELEDVAAVGSVVLGTQASTFRSAYARGAIETAGSATWLTNYVQAAFTAASLVGVTARLYSATFLANNAFFWLATGGSARLRLKINSTSPSTMTLESYNGTSATTLATSSLTTTAAVLIRLDVLVDYQASGRVRVWVDGVLFIDYSGNVSAGGGTTLDSVNFSCLSSVSTARWSEIIVTDGEDPRPLAVKTLVPNATGDVTGWTSGVFGDIDDTTASDVDLAVSDTAMQVLAVNCTGMPTGWGGLTVRAVKSVALCARGATGPSKLALGLRQSSTNGFATAQTLDTGYGPVSTTWTANPVTGLAFTPAEIEAIQLAYRSET